MQIKQIDGDYCCEHGTAVDVHCCNCHSGFLFDLDSCVCETIRRRSMQIKIRHNPITLDAIQWTSANEPEIREFVGEDSNIKLNSRGGLEVWNGEIGTWESVPHLGYIIKNRGGQFSVISEQEFEHDYSVVD